MLHLQHKSARKRLSLWVKLVVISIAGHLAALVMLFCVYRGSTLDMALTVRMAQLNNSIDVVWVSELPKGRSGSSGKSALREPSAGAKAMADRQGERKKKNVAQKKSNVSDPQTALKSDEQEKKKTSKLDKKAEDKTKNKKLEKKKIDEKKPEIKKVEPEKKPELIEEKKIIPEPKKKEEILESSVDAQVTNQSDDEDLNFTFSGSYRDLEALQQFQELQQEISRCWRPPVGIAQTVSCQIKVTFDWEGNVTQMETIKPSGMLLFDVSSRNAVAAMEAPKFVRGKTFTITFKP